MIIAAFITNIIIHVLKNTRFVQVKEIVVSRFGNIIDTCRLSFTSRMNQLPRVAHRLPAGGVAPPVHYRLQPTIYVRPSRQVPHFSRILESI